jgi:hypothetical protein
MSELPTLPTTPPEVSLLLRAHAEQHWLAREVLPVVREVETREVPEEQLPAALAYLEVVWAEAARRAGDTDGACTCLELALPGAEAPPPACDGEGLGGKARRYRAAVVSLREGLARRVRGLLGADAGERSAGFHSSPTGWAGA